MTAYLPNPRADRGLAYGDGERQVLSLAAGDRACAEIESWPGYAPTPLVRLVGLAGELGLAALLVKDEGARFGVGSFKALGGAYAVRRLLAQKEPAAEVVVTCATDGNHGRAVAWAARTFGCRAIIYLHERVSRAREEAIAAYGALIMRSGGNYDDSVRRCAEDAARNGWRVVSDTAWPGYEDIPRDVMQGYTVMVREATAEMRATERPTHVLAQGGVGGLAAAVLSHFWESLGAERPFFIVVEPDKADCLYRSAEAGERVAVGGELDTVMAGLACGEPSTLAWRILERGADCFVSIADDWALKAMRRLAEPAGGDARIVAGESGGAGLAGLLAILSEPALARRAGLGSRSRVLVFNTEGATDPGLYDSIVGSSSSSRRRT
ncbi:MAG: diaminopropionate ammonia-lyase [Alphaproteobacteria bacterium]|nr:diaminopropionate ammonia-lyase [Alphaproteobacteria bacterium]